MPVLPKKFEKCHLRNCWAEENIDFLYSHHTPTQDITKLLVQTAESNRKG